MEKWIVPQENGGFKSNVPLVEVIEAIAYGAKTGYQWRELPSKEFFTTEAISWNSVFTTSINGLNQAVGSMYGLFFLLYCRQTRKAAPMRQPFLFDQT